MQYSEYLDNIFPGIKVQKISVNAGFSCPNRDGTLGTGGCIYCRNDSFSPRYCINGGAAVRSQIEDGKRFFSGKYPKMKFLAYFQSFSNTYGRPIEEITKLYEEALGCKDIVGLVIATRPDTIDDDVLEYLRELSTKLPVFIEFGVETSSDSTLRLINRGHTWHDVEEAVVKAAAQGLHIGIHLIAGLPGEDEQQVIQNVKRVCSLPIETLKIHHLQILAGTALATLWKTGKIEVRPFELDEYLELCAKIYSIVPSEIVIERFLAQSPPEMVLAPKWGLKNYQFMNLLKARLMRER